MKKEFNLRSLAKALAHDISPKRIHAGLKAAEIIRRGRSHDPDSRLDTDTANLQAGGFQAVGMLLGFEIGALGTIGAILAAGGNGSSEATVAATFVGAIVGATLFNPVFARGTTKLIAGTDHAFTKLFNKIAVKFGEKEEEIKQFPQFEAFPEFRKAWAGNELKPQ